MPASSAAKARSSCEPVSTVAITGAKILTMAGDGAGAIANGTIVITGDRIAAIGPASSVQVPQGATVIDAAGKTIMPGLVDAHAHGPQGTGDLVPQQNWSLVQNLAMGTTTIHDPSSQASMIFAAAERQRAGTLLAPRTRADAPARPARELHELCGARLHQDLFEHRHGIEELVEVLERVRKHTQRGAAFGRLQIEQGVDGIERLGDRPVEVHRHAVIEVDEPTGIWCASKRAEPEPDHHILEPLCDARHRVVLVEGMGSLHAASSSRSSGAKSTSVSCLETSHSLRPVSTRCEAVFDVTLVG